MTISVQKTIWTIIIILSCFGLLLKTMKKNQLLVREVNYRVASEISYFWTVTGNALY